MVLITEFITSDLVSSISREYSLAQECFDKAIEYRSKALYHAKSCGEKLIEAKEKCPHGHWLSWLENNTVIPARTAQRFMAIALNWDLIEEKLESNDDDATYFGINEAQKLLTESKSSKSQKDKNATVADLSEDKIKALIFDSLNRTKQLEKEFSAFVNELDKKQKELILKVSESDIDEETLSKEEQIQLNTLEVKTNIFTVKLSEEESRRSYLEIKLMFKDKDPNLFNQWIQCEMKLNPTMIHEFITTDKYLSLDLMFDYFTPEEYAKWIEKRLTKNK